MAGGISIGAYISANISVNISARHQPPRRVVANPPIKVNHNSRRIPRVHSLRRLLLAHRVQPSKAGPLHPQPGAAVATYVARG